MSNKKYCKNERNVINVNDQEQYLETASGEDVTNDSLEEEKLCPSGEYHILVAKKVISTDIGDAGFFIRASGANQARAVAEELYPPSEYTIVKIKQIH